MFSFIGDILRFLFTLLRDLFVAPILALYAFVRQFVSETVIPWAMAKIPPELLDVVDAVDMSTLADLVSDVAWIVPIYACLAIQAAAFSVAGGIRLVRWILAFIPTIGG
jgi:hypothetical protein